MKALIHYPPAPPEAWRQLRAAFPEDTFVVAADEAALRREIVDAEVLISIGLVSGEVVRLAPGLRWIQVLSAGVEQLVRIPELRDSNIVVTNARVLLAPHVAETGIALLTGLTRGVNVAVRRQLHHQWQAPAEGQMDELTDKRALILGAGGIGRALAKRFHGLEMSLRVVDVKHQARDALLGDIRPVEELHALLGETDVLAVCCPLTEATRHLIGGTAFAAMPPGGYLVNVSRGGVVDTDALVAALRSGHLRGAALDVVEPEPLPAGHPLWDMENVLLTPHAGGRSPRRTERVVAFTLSNYQRYRRGEPLEHVVDKRAGF
ncbi:MAG: D-2-hydroxyacid dehydrogenase [Actinobacteria bacterium]|nr:D-2-hydroxyacid dehydrogenase [Actinomycetota bacterium]